MNQMITIFVISITLLYSVRGDIDYIDTFRIDKYVNFPLHEYNFLKNLSILWNLSDFSYWDFSNRTEKNPCRQPWKGVEAIYDNRTNNCYIEFLYFKWSVTGARPLPSVIENLSRLRIFDVSSNYISGTFPKFRNLPLLEEVILFDNHFTGSLSEDAFDEITAASIRKLYLQQNLFIGTLPSWIYKMKNLADLELHHNQFSGTLSQSMIYLKQLHTLYLQNNQFHGNIPSNFSQLSNLAAFYLDYNFFTGVITSNEVPPLCVLFSAAGNNFHGSFPFNHNLVAFLNIAYNYFTGSLPLKVCDVVSQGMITRVTVSYNLLTGTIPQCFWSDMAPKIQEWDHNLLHGSIAIPENHNPFRSLSFVSLGFNRLTGSFPVQIIEKSIHLKGFIGSGNCFTRGFESFNCSTIVGPKGLQYLKLDALHSPHHCEKLTHFPAVSSSQSWSNFGGRLPLCLLQSFHSLSELSMAGNGFTGSLPADIKLSTGLFALNLSHNMIRGSIPTWMQRRGFQSLDLSYNKLEGNAEELMSVAELGVEEGSLVSWRYDMLVLKQNRLSGRLWTKEVKERKDIDEDRWWVGGGGLKNMSVLDVLEGNMFACEVSRSGRLGLWDVFSSGIGGGERKGLVERYDVHGVHYMCEDRVMWMTLELSLLMVVVLVFVILTLLLVIGLYRKGFDCCVDFIGLSNDCKILDMVMRWKGESYGTNNEESERLGLINGVRAIDAMMCVSLLLAGYLLVIVVPVYVWLHEKGGGNNKYEEVYGWRVSSLFLVGERSGVVMMVLLGVMVVLYMIPVLLNGKRVESGSTSEVTVGARSWRRGKGRSEEAFDRSSGVQSGFEGWEVKVFAVGMYIIVFVLNFAMSMWVNIWYVRWMGRGESLGIGVSGEMELMMVQMGLGLYNVVWNRYVLVLVLRFLRMISKGLSLCGSVCGSREAWWEYEYGLMLLLVNSVIGPWLSVLIMDDSCMSRFWSDYLISAHISETLLRSYDLTEPCPSFEQHFSSFVGCSKTRVSYLAFSYYFTCASKTLVILLPVSFYAAIFSVTFRFIFFTIHWDRLLKPSNIPSQVLLLDFIYFPSFPFAKGQKPCERETAKEKIKMKGRESLSSTQSLLVLVHPTEISQQWSCDMSLLFCFGLNDPLRLGLILCANMWLEGLRWKWLMYRYCFNHGTQSHPRTEAMEVFPTFPKNSKSRVDANAEISMEEGLQLLPVKSSKMRKKSVSKEKVEITPNSDSSLLSSCDSDSEEEMSEAISKQRLNEALIDPKQSLCRYSPQTIFLSLVFNGFFLFDMIGDERGWYEGMKYLFTIVIVGILLEVVVFLSGQY